MDTKTDLKCIDPKSFQHPSDIRGVAALRALKGFDFVCHKMMEYGYERVQYINLIGNHVKITNKQCPKIYEILIDGIRKLGVDEPTLFIGQSSEMNAYTSGAEKPFIVVNSSLIEELTQEELHVVICHELGHIKCNHVIYMMVADFVRDFAEILSGATMGLGKVLTSGLELALYNWYRKAELSCDRAALLATGNIDACTSTLMKLAGGAREIAQQLDVEEFVKQAELYKELDSSIMNKVYKFLLIRYQTHPFAVLRAKEINEWSKTEQYHRLLRGESVAGLIIEEPSEAPIKSPAPEVLMSNNLGIEVAREKTKDVTSRFKGFMRHK